MFPVALLVHVDQIAFIAGSWNWLWPRKGRLGPVSPLPCTGLFFNLRNGESMENPVQHVCKKGQCLCPIAQQILHVLHNLFIRLYWNSLSSAPADVFFPFKKCFNALALWGDYSNISHILMYLESYIFCNFDLVILCWSLLTSPVVSVKQIIKKKIRLYMHVVVWNCDQCVTFWNCTVL